MGFTGFPAAAFAFYAGLRADNSRAYWTAHRAVYEDSVRAPLAALLDELAEDFGGAVSVFRPFRDTRFSRDKSPYKTHQGGFVEVAPAGRCVGRGPGEVRLGPAAPAHRLDR